MGRYMVGLGACAATFGIAQHLYGIDPPGTPWHVRLRTVHAEVARVWGFLAAFSWETAADVPPHELASLLPSTASLQSQGMAYKPTLVIALDGVVLAREYDPKFGHLYVRRPGLEALLLAASAAGCEVILWSSQPSAGASVAVDKLIVDIIAQDTARYHAFSDLMNRKARELKAVEMARAEAEGRAPRAHLLRERLFANEIEPMYREQVLNIRAVLGREHMTQSDGRRVRPLAALPRDLADVLLIDSDPTTLQVYGNNVILIPELAPGHFNSDDPTLPLIASMIQLMDAARDVSKHASSITAWRAYMLDMAKRRGLRPETGRSIDDTVGILGMVLEIERQRAAHEREGKQEEASAST